MATAKTYEAYAVHTNGDRVSYPGLTKSRALWRFHWFARQVRNNPKADIKAYGWRIEA